MALYSLLHVMQQCPELSNHSLDVMKLPGEGVRGGGGDGTSSSLLVLLVLTIVNLQTAQNHLMLQRKRRRK